MGPKWLGGTLVQVFDLPEVAMPPPHFLLQVALGALAFFLLYLSSWPAFTTSFSSFLHSGQYQSPSGIWRGKEEGARFKM